MKGVEVNGTVNLSLNDPGRMGNRLTEQEAEAEPCGRLKVRAGSDLPSSGLNPSLGRSHGFLGEVG